MNSSLESKIKLTFNPCMIDPVTIDFKKLKPTIAKLREFDLLWDAIRSSLRDSIWYSIRDSVIHSIWTSMSDSMQDSMWYLMQDSMWDSMKDSMCDSIHDLMRDSMRDSMRGPMRDFIEDSMYDSMYDSMRVSMWASMMQKLSQNEYEALFEEKSMLKDFPYIEIKKLYDLYHWFSEQGLFPHRAILKGSYILGSWKNPKILTVIDIN